MRKLGKKDLTLLFLSVALILSIIGNGILIFNYPQQPSQRDPLTLVVGTSSGPITLEIVDSDHTSEDTLGQVVETLFTNDFYDPDLPRINLLAESYWWENTTTLHIKLREGILFHDGTTFNASAAKWNFDRLQYLINATGTNKGDVAHTRELWMRPDGQTPIINNVAVVGSYNLTFTLNGAYGPFLNTLTLINAGMISPTAHEADAKNFLGLGDTLVGTGPFVYDHYTPDVEVIFTRWNEYWGKVAYFKKLHFKIYDDANSAHKDMLAGKIDFNGLASDENIALYEDEEHITVKRYTDDTGIPSLVYQYMTFNNNKFNQTWRKAMSYAINYSNLIDVLRERSAIRAKSPISPGFGLTYNESVKAANYNLTRAREFMVSMGFGDMGWTDAQWIAVATSNSPFLFLDYIYDNGNQLRENLGNIVRAGLKSIGIEVYVEPYDPWWYDPFSWIFLDYSTLDVFFHGWAPDYLDPFNMLDPLVNPNSDYNYANINDTTLSTMMDLALETTNDLIRNNIYKNIQSYMAEEGYFHAYLYHSKIIFVHSADLRGVPYKAFGRFQAHGIWRV